MINNYGINDYWDKHIIIQSIVVGLERSHVFEKDWFLKKPFASHMPVVLGSLKTSTQNIHGFWRPKAAQKK